MADNYLEKRMDDLRSGRLGGRSGASSSRLASRGGWLQWKFPPLRVLVIEDTASPEVAAFSEALVRRLVALGCKVALTDGDAERGAALSHDPGVRYYPLGDEAAAARDIASLLGVWRDLDAVIVLGVDPSEWHSAGEYRYGTLLPAIEHTIARHRRNLPYPNSYGGRWLNVSLSYSPESLVRFSFSVNSIEIPTSEIPEHTETLLRTLLFLLLPECAPLSVRTLRIGAL